MQSDVAAGGQRQLGTLARRAGECLHGEVVGDQHTIETDSGR
jgi:hypothetical protein